MHMYEAWHIDNPYKAKQHKEISTYEEELIWPNNGI